jgi:ubiquinone/menaquinone biosynthesis C-methylase UbiE
MGMQFNNVYEDAQRAEAYANLEFPGTYYLAYRDLPEIISEHIRGKKALDFGCGAGRSTRFLKKIGFDAIGVDIAEDMLKQARTKDSDGHYLRIEEGSFDQFRGQTFDLVLAAFTFDNVPTQEKKVTLFRGLKSVLKNEGRIVSVVSSPEIYKHEWASFTTKEFPENQKAKNGERVRIIMTDVEDHRPVEDILWTYEAYRAVYDEAGLGMVKMYTPLGQESEPYKWVSETKIAPWIIYVLQKAGASV